MNWVVQNQFFILLGSLIIGLGIEAWFLFDLKKKMQIILGDSTSGGDFQKDLVKRVVRTETKLEELEPRMKMIEGISKISVQKVGFLRFNPFQDTGGDQSFILAMLDREDNGVLLSSLYNREGIRLYAKAIECGRSKHALSEEEEKVLTSTVKKHVL